MSSPAPPDDQPTPLHLEGWTTWARQMNDLRPERQAFESASGDAAIDTLLFLDRRGRIRAPAGVPYVAVAPRLGLTTEQSDLAPLLDRVAEHMRSTGVHFRAALMPGLSDVRPWQWRGYIAVATYTFIIPLDPRPAPSRMISRALATAEAAGYTCVVGPPIDEAIACLRATEKRQGFTYPIRDEELRAAAAALGPDHLRIYAAYDRDGEVASSRFVLHRPGAAAIDWLAGTRADHLKAGAAPLLIRFVLDDITAAGAARFDFGGANHPSIAASKAAWRGTLTPTYAVQQRGLRSAIWACR
jgi:hypothetical protein